MAAEAVSCKCYSASGWRNSKQLENQVNKVSRTPDFDVKALKKNTNEKARIGAAWANEDGSVSIVLDAFVVVPSSPDLIITLFPRKAKA